MLIAIKQYLIEKQMPVTLTELAMHFEESADAMRAMLEHWIQKGKVCRAPLPQGCGARCQRCEPVQAELYRWSEN